MTASADWSTFDQEKEWIIPEEAQTAFVCFGITILQNGDRLNQVAIQDLKMWKTIGTRKDDDQKNNTNGCSRRGKNYKTIHRAEFDYSLVVTK